jgi:hypothetical protein
MRLRKMAGCEDGQTCPAIWLEEETGDVVVQGYEVTDPAILAALGLPAGETAVRVPRETAARLGLA